MTLLLDANLSWRLIKILDEHFSKILHVDNVGLSSPPTDGEIWDWAQKNDSVIVTNDEDFIISLCKKASLLKLFY